MPAPASKRQEREAKRLRAAGSRLLHARKLKPAVKKLQQAADLMPQDLTTRINLGTAYYLTGQPRLAIDQFTEAARIDSENPTVLLNLAAAKNAVGDSGGAIEALEKALAINPKHPDCHYNLAVAYLARNERERCFQELGKELQINPDNRNALQLLYQLIGDPEATPVSDQLPLSDPAIRTRKAWWRRWLLWLVVLAAGLLVAYFIERSR